MPFPLILDASNIDAWTATQRVFYGNPGPPLVLTGPAGVGKTRLLDAAIEDIERRRPRETVLRCAVQTIADVIREDGSPGTAIPSSRTISTG